MPARVILALALSAGLIRGAAPAEGFRFAIIGDPQVRRPDHESTALLRRALQDLTRFAPLPQFVIAVGDLVDGRSGKSLDCSGSVYEPQYQLLAQLLQAHLDRRIAFYPVVGNHDYHRSRDGSPSGPELYAKFWFPRIPANAAPRGSPYYSFVHGNTHFTIIATGLLGVRKAPDYHDLVFGKQYEWLRRDLERAAADPTIKHILVFGHHNFYPVQSKGPSDWPGLAVARERICRGLFVKYGVRAYIHGHWHFYDRGRPEGGVPYVCLAGLDGLERPKHPRLRVNHYAIADVTDSEITISVHLLGRRLYDRFGLVALAQGKVKPPQQAVAETPR